MLKLVPFNFKWINHDKMDVHAIYRRPRFVADKYGELQRDTDPKTGRSTWDLTGGLPVRSHTRWVSKGFEYVTLSDRESLIMAGRAGTIAGVDGKDWRAYDQHQTGGPWSWKKYDEGFEVMEADEMKQLTEDVCRFGSEAVLVLQSRANPDFVLPEYLRNVPPGTTAEDVEQARLAWQAAATKAAAAAEAKAAAKAEAEQPHGRRRGAA